MHLSTRIRGRNSNTQLLMGFSDVLMIIWFYRKTRNWKYDFFFLKNYFYKTQVINLFLKCFIIKLHFYKSKFETTWFCRLACLTRKLVWSYWAYFLTHFSRYMNCMVILMLIGIGCHTFGGESVNSIWPDCHENYMVARYCTFHR